MLPLLIEPETLHENLNAEKLMIIDLCSYQNYERFHIPGAIHVKPEEIISGIKPATGKLPPLGQLEAVFSRIGYSPGSHIVAYDDEGGGWAGRFIWTLDVVGHASKSYLNGGLLAWASARLPLTNEIPKTELSRVMLQIDNSVIAEKSDVIASINNESVIVWDARSPEEYSGNQIFAARGGHVPEAINLNWLELMDPQRDLRLISNLQELLADKGLTQKDTVITHCQTHHRSGLSYLVGKLLGLNIKAYHGSWSEWGNDPDTPIETTVN